jgi:hypothetical protein
MVLDKIKIYCPIKKEIVDEFKNKYDIDIDYINSMNKTITSLSEGEKDSSKNI